MRQKGFLRRLWLGVLASCLSLMAWAAPDSAMLEMTKLMQPGPGDTIESVASAPAAQFSPTPQGFTGGFSRQAQWYRLTLTAAPGEWWLSIIPPLLDDVRLFVPDPNKVGAFLERRAGDTLAFSVREEDYRGFVFKLQKPQATPMVVYLRVQTDSSLRMRVRVHSPTQFRAAMALEYGVLMTVIGAAMVLILINLHSLVAPRDPLALRLILYLASLTLVFVFHDGFVSQYLLPDEPLLVDRPTDMVSLIAIGAGSAFYRRLFELKPQQRLVFHLFRFASWLPLPAILLLLTGLAVEVMAFSAALVLFMLPVNAALSIQYWRRRAPGAAMVMTANLISVVGAMMYFPALLGVLPYTVVYNYGSQASALGVAVALHFATLTRFRSAQAAARRAVEQAQEEAEKRRQQTEFVAMLSHELKTPLAMIDGSVQSLELLVQTTPEVARRYERIRRAVARINELVMKFLTYSRLDRRNPPLRPRELQLDELVRETVAGFAQREGRIVLDLESGVRLSADDGLLKVLVGNLIDNALKYSPPASVVSVTLRQSGGMARLRVQDQGSGVPASLRERLFDSYVRGEQVGDVPGAGLGLHLVRKIARLHGGDAQLLAAGADNTFRGALFEATLPVTIKET